MKLRKLNLLRIIVAALLLLVAAAATVFIRDALALQNPEGAIPEIQVYYTGTAGNRPPLPADHVMMSSYSWRFLFTMRQGHAQDAESWDAMAPAWMEPGARLEVEFSRPCRNVKIYRSADNKDFELMPVELFAPTSQNGENFNDYTYRVEADWGSQGTVLYYFRIRVPVW